MSNNLVGRNDELGIEIVGRSLVGIYRVLCGKLSVDGPRAITLAVSSGAEIHCSLYSGESFITSSNGRIIYSS